MRINVASIRNDPDGFDRIAAIATKVGDLRFDMVDLDFSCCDFFEANMAAPLYTIVARLVDRLNEISILNMPDNVRNILRKNKFMTVFDDFILADTYNTILPFKIFKLNTENQFNDYLEAHMKGKGIPKMSKKLAKQFYRNLFEIFSNSSIHSESRPGIFVCGQFFPRKQRVDFSISDAGVGIHENVQRYTGKKMNSCEAIEWAIADGNTTKTGSQPGGLGLRLLKDFIRINKGKLQLVSGDGYYEFSTTGESFLVMSNYFPGTCVNVEINTSGSMDYYLEFESTTEDIF